MSKSKRKTKTKEVTPMKANLPKINAHIGHDAGARKYLHQSKRAVLWLGSAGFLTFVFAYLVDYLGRDVRLDYSQALESGYEFVIRNDGPSDQLIKSFRLKPPVHQDIIYKTTEDVRAIQNPDGTVTLPGGNLTWIPAYQFRGLDGLVLRAKTEKKFRLPPLSSQSWVKPEAALIDFEFVAVSQNNLLQLIERGLSFIGLNNSTRHVSFMVIDNYWTPVASGKYKDAIDQACTEQQSLAQTRICRQRVH